MDNSIKFLNAAQVRARYGNVSDMTIWRWLNSDAVQFPQPVYFGRLRFWRIADLEAWEAQQPGAQPREVA